MEKFEITKYEATLLVPTDEACNKFKAYNEYGLPIINKMLSNFQEELTIVQARTEIVENGAYSFYKYSKYDRFYLSILLCALNENIELINSKFPEVPNKQQPIKIQDL